MAVGIVYLAIAGAIWPVYSLLLLRRSTPETQYLAVGKAAGLALVWPPMLVVTLVGVAVLRTVRHAKRRRASQALIAVPAND